MNNILGNKIIYLIITISLFSTSFINYDNYTNKSDNNEDSENLENQSLSVKYLKDLYSGHNFWWSLASDVPDSIKNIALPRYPEEVYKNRISAIDNKTPIKLDYNEHVLSYIEAYGILNNKKMRNIMALSAYYFPIFEEYLAKYSLPIELKYLAAVESALDPNAVSRSGAVGLWQFMKNTSDILDITVNSYIDERRDVYKSTEAACKYLEYLYRTYNDWQLALVAYNGGPGMVSKAIARSGGKTNYWELRPYFTDQMQNYVPAFIAMTYLMNYHAEHNIFPNEEKIIDFYKYDTVQIKGPIKFEQIQGVIGLSTDSLQMLNPMYIKSFIPGDRNDYSLVLPKNHLIPFLLQLNDIYNYEIPEEDFHDLLLKAGDTTGREKIYHRVAPGETLNQISIKYGVTIYNIIAWNELSKDYVLRFDDVLKIFVKSEN